MYVDPSDDFRGCVERYFSFLFSGYDCKFVAEMSANGSEYQMQIVASDSVQVKFTLEQASLDMLLAHPGVPRVWSNDPDGVEVWHSFSYLKLFMDQTDPKSAMLLTNQDRGQMPALMRSLTNKASLLKYYMPRLTLIFSPNPPLGWWAAFDAFKTAWRAKAG